MDLAALKARLSDVPGIETLTLTQIGGRLVFGFNGLVAAVDPSATEDQVVSAIRTTSALRPAPMPPVQPQPKAKPMSVTGASHAGMSLKKMLEDRKQAMAAAHSKVESSFAKLDQATAALDSVGDKVAAEADDLMASIGQFTNSLGGE